MNTLAVASCLAALAVGSVEHVRPQDAAMQQHHKVYTTVLGAGFAQYAAPIQVAPVQGAPIVQNAGSVEPTVTETVNENGAASNVMSLGCALVIGSLVFSNLF